jgi:hypothetical protein
LDDLGVRVGGSSGAQRGLDGDHRPCVAISPMGSGATVGERCPFAAISAYRRRVAQQTIGAGRTVSS